MRPFSIYCLGVCEALEGDYKTQHQQYRAQSTVHGCSSIPLIEPEDRVRFIGLMQRTDKTSIQESHWILN